MSILLSQSPDYIMEKFNHWIVGNKHWEFRKINIDKISDDDSDFLHDYWQIWKLFRNDNIHINQILLYLLNTENMNILNCVDKFEKLIGNIEDINDIKQFGLHEIVIQDAYPIVLEKNKIGIKLVTRDLKLKSLI